MIWQKHGTAIWISYLFMVVLMISLGIMYYSWASEHTTQTMNSARKTFSIADICSNVGISIDKSYLLDPDDSSKGLYIEIENTDTIAIYGLMLVPLQGANPIGDIRQYDLFIRPGDRKVIVVDLQNGTEIHLTPIIRFEGNVYPCTDKGVRTKIL